MRTLVIGRMSTIAILVLLFVSLGSNITLGQKNTRSNEILVWTMRENMPTPRSDLALAAADNGKIYAIGGWYHGSTAVVEEYDPSTNTWSSKASMPTARTHPKAVQADNGKIYVVGGRLGGYDFSSIVEVYDPATDSWSSAANMPTARIQMGIAVVNGKIFVIGGENETQTLNIVEEYDPSTNTWRSRASMPTARTHLVAVTGSNGKIYVIGGCKSLLPPNTIYCNSVSDDVEEYDPLTDSWTVRAKMPTPRYWLAAAAYGNGKIYAIGGYNGYQRLSTVEEYDPATDAWQSQTSLPTPRFGFSAVTATNGRIYTVGGWTTQEVGTVEEGVVTTAHSISGRVMDSSNNGISGVTISDGEGHTAVTDSNGNYTLIGLLTGTYTITPSKSGYTFSPASRAVTVPPNKIGQDFVALVPPQTCVVPFFWQREGWPQQGVGWWEHPLRTNSGCLPQCSTIGACGCTLTSAAMVFSYYGANLNPPTLSDCMGTSACPFSWGTGASCTNGKATYVGQYAFSWNRLEQELNQNHRPVILGMHKKGDPNDTHWVVVISGHGNDPSNYYIHDPWFVGGANMKLSARTRSYDLDWISVYSGQPSCTGTSLAALGPSAISRSPMLGSTSIVTGTALIYNMAEVTMTVQLIAQSSAGNITEMLVWTDEITNPTWQPFFTLVEMPVSDHVYARFRDEFGNESDQASDTIYPINTPRNPLLNIFLPMILK